MPITSPAVVADTHALIWFLILSNHFERPNYCANSSNVGFSSG